MVTKFALKPFLVLFVVMLLSTLVVGSAVIAKEGAFSTVTSPASVPVPIDGGPGFISVSTFGFVPYAPEMLLTHNNMWLENGSQTDGVYFAPVYLPHKANLTKVVFFYYDTVPADMVFYLERVNLFTGDRAEAARAYPTGTAGFSTIECDLFEPYLIDNQLYSYILQVDIPGGYSSNLSLINIRIDYGYTGYFPTIQR